MVVLEIVVPSTAGLDPKSKLDIHDAQTLLSLITDGFFDAQIALMHLDAANEVFRRANAEEFMLVRAIDRANRTGLAGRILSEWSARRRDLAERRKAWAAGAMPSDFQWRAIELHARMFVFALDTFCKLDGFPALAVSLRDEVKKELPDLIGVRDTAHHMEDRVLGKDKQPRKPGVSKINLQPLPPSSGLPVDMPAFVWGHRGRVLQYTMTDGHLGQIEVSLKTLRQLQQILQRLYDGLPWHKPPPLVGAPPADWDEHYKRVLPN